MTNMKKKNGLLIVDDDTSILMEVVHMFQSEYTIYTAKDGASALKRAEKIMPDLILLDVVMPDMNGFEVLDELKKSAKTRDIPVIFITGLNEDQHESAGLSIGAVDYIRKPFDTTITKHRIRNQIQLVNLRLDLKHAVKNAEMANQAKSAFLANMSHEIRTPMNAILGVTEIMIQNEKLPAEIEDGLEKIYSSCDLLLGIINDILDFSKIEAGKLDIIPALYKIASMINDSVHLNMMRINDKPIEFELQIDEKIPAKLIGDELRIKQVLNNLLSNAFKYTDAGKVTLSVTAETMPDKKSATLILNVRDTGHGMTKEQLSKMFDEYSRFHQKSGKNVEGTGLGLAIAQSLIILMNGEVHVESEPCVGSLFTVRIPQETVDDEVLGKEVATNLQRFRKNYMTLRNREKIARDPMPYGSVLIVDDVETNLYVAEGLMRLYRLQIDTAMSGQEAIDKLKHNTYDVVFMDHMMPGMDGIETTTHLRAMGHTVPIVALTANAVAGQSDIFLQSGFDSFISKPIDIRQLNSVLNKLVRDKQPPEVIEAARRQKYNTDGDAQLHIDPRLMESFIRDAIKTAASLEELAQRQEGWAENSNDLRNFTIMIHGIKSSLHNVGEEEISELAHKLEIAGQERNLDVITTCIPAFLNRLRALIKNLEPTKDENGKDEDTESLRGKLSAIREMCANYNRKGALDLTASIKKGSKETTEVLERITEYVVHSDFDEAEREAAEYAAKMP